METTSQSALWSTSAQDWADYEERRTTHLVDALLDALHVGPTTTLLDAGCGAGMAATRALARGATVTGLDASAAMVEVAAARAAAARFDVGDLQSLPYASASFDVAFAINSVFFCADMDAAMRELARVTRAGGKVAITAWGSPDRCDMAPIFGALAAMLLEKPVGPFALASPGALDRLVERAGLTITTRGETSGVVVNESWETFWRGMLAAGPIQGAVRALGAEKVATTVREAIAPFVAPSGAIALDNTFTWVIGEKR